MTDAIGEAFARRLVRRLLAEERDPAAALKAFVDAVRSSTALQDIVLGNESPPFDDAHWAGYATAFMIRVVLEQRAELGMGPIEYPKCAEGWAKEWARAARERLEGSNDGEC